MQQPRTIIALLTAAALTITLAACSPADASGYAEISKEPAESVETQSERTWLFYSSNGPVYLANFDSGTIEAVSPKGVTDPLVFSSDNQYMVGDHGSSDVAFDIYRLGGGTGLTFDITDLDGFSRGLSISKILFKPDEPHTLQVILRDDRAYQMWRFDVADEAIKDAKKVQEFEGTHYLIDRMDGSMTEVVEAVPTPEEMNEAIIEAAVYYGFVRDHETHTADEIRAKFPLAVEEAENTFVHMVMESRLLAEARVSPYAFGRHGGEGVGYITPDGTQWQFDSGATSLVAYTRLADTDEWKKYGETLSLAGMDNCCPTPKPSL